MEIFGEVGAKMGPRWTQDGLSWQQVASKMGHDGAKIAILVSVWELLRGSWEGFGSSVGRCWLQVGVFLDILGDVVASWCQDGAQERQDEAR